MHDLMNHINIRPALSPVAATTDNTAYVSNILDLQGYDSAMLALVTGSLADVDATFAVTLSEGNASNLSDASAVAAIDMLGGLALASFTFAADNSCVKLGYIGNKRYIRATVTPANNTGNVFLAGVWVMGRPNVFPTPNPPV